MFKRIFIKVFSLCFLSVLNGQSIYSNTITGTNPGSDNPYTIGEIIDTNITGSGIGRGPDINELGVATNDRYNARSWELSFNSNKYFYITITPNTCYEIDFTSFVFNGQPSLLGPASIVVRSSLDGYASNIGSTIVLPLSVETQSTIDLTGSEYQNVDSVITFRIYAYGATNGNGTFSINDFTFNGVVSSSSTSTWSGSSWDNGAPDISTTVIIDGNYDTTDDGSFSACNLTVNSGSTLTVSNSTYVEVDNNIVADGDIIVESQGSVIQNKDLATVTENGAIKVEKETAPTNAWYEYTYWSAPVLGETIGTALSNSQTDRRFFFNAQNYLDATKETNNDDTAVTGQDDIDDDGDDWQSVGGSTIMTPGVGYISTHSKTLFNSEMSSPPYQFEYEFSGPFNNGSISVPIYRNDLETNDNNWNLIGNPYPSAIDADAFLLANSDIDGAIYLWSHNTSPSATNNGNQPLNFSASDYAIINDSSETAGGDGVTPGRTIPSCQGFFISYSNSGTVINTNGNIKEGSVTFNNSMRVKGVTDNSQFFKSANAKKRPADIHFNNKLWIDLTSDNGVFSQISLGYIEGATKHDDGMRYDAVKIIASRSPAVLYSTIKDSDKKFAIQGKGTKDLTIDEKIQLGFSTVINVPTLYTLSIAKFQGLFFEENTIYLKDKVLKTIYDLSASDYTFTSDVGEFNERFEIVFKADALTTDTFTEDKTTFEMVDLGNDYVSFRVSNGDIIQTISIFDLLGRQLYSFKNLSKSEVFDLSAISTMVYIVQVKLLDGTVLTKKVVKK